MSSRSRRTFPAWCSRALFPTSSRLWWTPATPTWRRFGRQRWCCSTGCSSCSTPRTAACCPSTTLRYGRLRPAQESPRRHRAPNSPGRRLLSPRHELLRPRDNAGQAHRRRRRLHRSAALQRRSVRAHGRAAAGSLSPARRRLRPHRPRPEPHRDGRRAGFVNYRDMSVQQLGSIYERLLEREPVRNSQGEIDIRPIPTRARTAAASTRPRSWWT